MAAREMLQSIPLFSRVSGRDLSRLVKEAGEYSYEAGTVLTSKTSSGHGFFVILDGKARVEIEGRRAKILNPGDYFGEMALIDSGSRSAVVTAQTDLRCLILLQLQFRDFVKQHPDVAWALLEAMVQRVREMES